MTLTTAGNVGIGTTTPGVRLHVSSNVEIARWSSSSANGNNYQTFVNSGGRKAYLGLASGSTDDFFIHNDANAAILFDTNNAERMRITGAGDVGIGTSSPANTLQVDAAGGGVIRISRLSASATNNMQLQHDGTNGSIVVVGANNLLFNTNSAERMRIDSSGNVGVNNTSPAVLSSTVQVAVKANVNGDSMFVAQNSNGLTTAKFGFQFTGSIDQPVIGSQTNHPFVFLTNNTERMRITSAGEVVVGATSFNDLNVGVGFLPTGYIYATRDSNPLAQFNRKTNDGTLINFCQDNFTEGTISVSGTTVSYNGGHLSRWSQWQNQTGKPEVYRGSVLDSTNDMCEWNQENEQATKTIVSTTAKSKAVAGVFDMYDLDDENNPQDFYVAQSGDFVIRIAQGVVVENGDLLESAGDGTARPQTDDICRSSTVAKVTSNYVSTTYADGSYCVPCILMIG
jgi:hypothetical protein